MINRQSHVFLYLEQSNFQLCLVQFDCLVQLFGLLSNVCDNTNTNSICAMVLLNNFVYLDH